MGEKYICRNCGEKIYEHQLLIGMHPFDKEEEVYGCPACKDINNVLTMCEYADCWSEATRGLFTPPDYQKLCGEHYLKETN